MVFVEKEDAFWIHYSINLEIEKVYLTFRNAYMYF